jgi:hypothetical protein
MGGGIALVVAVEPLERVADAGGVHAEEGDQGPRRAVAMQGEDVHGAVHRQVPFVLAPTHDVGVAVVGAQGAVPRHRHPVVERRLVAPDLRRRDGPPGGEDRLADRRHHGAEVRGHEAGSDDVVERLV